MIPTDVLIIGGGLSGLALADKLQQAGLDYRLVEARARYGGRIMVHSSAVGDFDLGPSWFWPGQPRIAAMTQRFHLGVFDQYSTGALSYENERGEVLRDQGWSSMQGSVRLEGGMVTLIDSLVNSLPKENLSLGQSIERLVRTNELIEAYGPDGDQVARARQVVLALPPRVVSKVMFEPALPEAAMRSMRSINTWMAGHAKFVAIYDTPFWRTAGLSGDAMSRHGPMVELHDASDPRSSSGAIFGFLGVPANVREGQRKAVIDACIAQLSRIFGSQAQSPHQTFLQDWAFEPETSIEADHILPSDHPQYGLPIAMSKLWDGALRFGSTEVASQFGGFLEGALEAAENVSRIITAAHSPTSG